MGISISRKLWWVLKIYGHMMIFEIFFGPEVNFENDPKISF